MDHTSEERPMAESWCGVTRGFVHEAAVGASIEWYTPEWIFQALATSFDLDPCSPGLEKTFVPARKAYTKEDDGLSQPWHGHVWCNPPYGRGIDAWMQRCAEHGDAIALVPSRTDTVWFQEMAESADLLLFVKQRIKFHPGSIESPNNGSPGAGSVLVAWGERAVKELKGAAITGVRVSGAEL